MKKIIFEKALIILAFNFSYSLVFAQVGLSHISENQRYSVIAVAPSTKGLPEAEKLKKTIQDEVQKIADQAIKTTALGLLQPKGLSQLFVQLGQEMNDNLSPFVQEINSQLPVDDSLTFSTYIIPFKKIDSSIKIQMPIINEAQIHAVDLGQLSERENYSFYMDLKSNIYQLPLNKTDEFQFVALATHIRLIKNFVQVKVQLLGQLKSQQMEFIKSNDEVNITQLAVDASGSEKPLVILDITQRINTSDKEKLTLPSVDFDFGQFGGFSGGYAGSFFGEMKIYKDLTTNDGCSRKIGFTPRLVGTLGSAPAGRSIFKYPVNKFLKDRPVNFHIFSLKLNPESFKISEMQVVTSLNDYSFLSCVQTKDVNQKFMDEANSAIDSAFQSIYKQDAVSDEMVQALFE